MTAPRQLTDIVISCDYDDTLDPEHCWIEVTGAAYYAEEDPAAFGHPSDAALLAAKVYAAGILARLTVRLAERVEAEAVMHGCGPETIWVRDREDVNAYRRLQRGDEVGPTEYVARPLSDSCYWSANLDDLGKNDGSPEVTFMVPKARRKAWIKQIGDYLAQMAEEDRWLP